MNGLVNPQQMLIDVRGQISMTGWQVPSDINYDEWSEVMRNAGKINRGAGWIIGDGLRFANERWHISDEAEILTGLDKNTLRQLRDVAEYVNSDIRMSELTITHHKEIMKFRDEPNKQIFWLKLAKQNEWSAKKLHESILEDEQARHQADVPEPQETKPEKPPEQPKQESKPATKPQAQEPPPAPVKMYLTLDEWNTGDRLNGSGASNATMNETNDNIEWAAWSWNPITGCLHNCDYCYARDIANRFYEQGFAPSFIPSRLSAPANTRQSKPRWNGDTGYKNVFTCSMADLFGKWVPRDWIKSVIQVVESAPQWTFLFLTKFPIRMAEFSYPPNVWLGTTVDKQYAVDRAESAFKKIKASGFKGICWLSCEPMLEHLQFTNLKMFDWVVMGGASKSTQTPEMRPPFDDVVSLYQQARKSGCKVYMKTNLGIEQRIREYPE